MKGRQSGTAITRETIISIYWQNSRGSAREMIVTVSVRVCLYHEPWNHSLSVSVRVRSIHEPWNHCPAKQ